MGKTIKRFSKKKKKREPKRPTFADRLEKPKKKQQIIRNDKKNSIPISIRFFIWSFFFFLIHSQSANRRGRHRSRDRVSTTVVGLAVSHFFFKRIRRRQPSTTTTTTATTTTTNRINDTIRCSFLAKLHRVFPRFLFLGLLIFFSLQRCPFLLLL